jgi:hypothetical protein
MNEVIERPSEERSTALTIIPSASLPTILAMTGAPDILKSLSDELAAFKPDISTPKGRAAIASMAAKVATAKMDIVRIANSTTEEWRTKTKLVVSERNDLEERMDALKAEVRAPLTEFENREKERVSGHEQALTQIGGKVHFDGEPSSTEIETRIAELHAVPARDWQEFDQRARDEFSAADERLHGKLARAKQREAQEAEEARLRDEKAERDRLATIKAQEEREAQIAAQAAEQARLAAEAKAAQEAADAAKKVDEARLEAERAARAERDRIEREAREAAEVAQRERDRIAAEARAAEERAKKAESDRLAAIEATRLAEENAERARKAAAEKAEQDRIAAVEAERERVARGKEAEEAAATKREANVAHRKRINGEVLADMMKVLRPVAPMVAGGAEAPMEGIAKAVITAIAKQEIKHVTIGY